MLGNRVQLTENVAARLIKARARHFVYSERAKATQNPALAAVASLEAEIMLESESAWLVILRGWEPLNPFDRRALVAIINRAKEGAQQSARTSFDDKITVETLARYVDAFKPEDIITIEEAS